MLAEFYKGYEIVGSAVRGKEPNCWIPKVTIFPPVRIGLGPTVLTGPEGSFIAQDDAEAEAIRIGKEWVDRRGPKLP